MEEFLGPVEDAIRDFFVPAILHEKTEKITDYFRQLLAHRVKQGVLNICSPAKSTSRLHQSSSEECATLVVLLKDNKNPDSLPHAQCVM